MKKVLITGGTGFIGSALVKEMLRRGYDVRVFDNDSRGRATRLDDVADQLDMVHGDIRDEDAVLRATEGVDEVYHLAFVNGTRFFYEVPELVLDVGVRGALTTLKAAMEHKVARYVLASSSEVYQTPTRIPTDESERILLEDITNPRYSYAGGKIISELLTLNYLRKTGTDAVIFRPHNIYGPDMGFEHVIPELMKKIVAATDGLSKTECTIQIQGSGDETRAFCYVDNAVDGIILCGEKGGDGEIYHVGEMRETSIKELVALMGEALGVSIAVEPAALRPGGTPRRCPDTSKLAALGYAPRVSMRDGLEKTVRWYAEAFRQ